ncbi:MAG: transcriptional regulator, AraC family [Paenibacillus sp.]|nr:transcriptional regulator, AraC family [Paenibacillus sp.]
MRETAFEFHETVYFVPDTFVKSGGVWLLRVGHNIAKPEYAIEARKISWYNIHFIMQGQLIMHYDHNQVILNKGDAFCMFPGIYYKYGQVSGDKPLKMLWISFEGAQSHTLLTKAGFSESEPFLRQIMTKELHHTLQQLFVPPSEGYQRSLELQADFYRAFRLMTPDEESAIPSNGPASWVPKSIQYMQTHYMERVTVQDVSDYLSIHRAYLSKVFTEKVGMTPMRYLEKLKMDKALELLHISTHSIQDIAVMIGYSDPYTFTHAFSKYYGIPPGKWRRTHAAKLSES